MKSSSLPQSCRFLSVLGATALFGSTIVLPVASTLAQSVPPQALITAPPAPDQPILAAIQNDLSNNFGIMNQIKIVSTKPETWPDGCLGLTRYGDVCTMATVPGFRFVVTDGVQTWTYRTDTTGASLRLEAVTPELPTQISQKLKQQVAKQTQNRPAQVKITTVKPTTFNGCIGLYRPNQACTMQLIFGWQVAVTSRQRIFIYHLTKDGSRILQNPTASGAKAPIRVAFDRLNQDLRLESKVIFQSETPTDQPASYTRVVLTEDGKITRQLFGPTIRSVPVDVKTLTPAQINAFKSTLENQRFPNLNGISYLSTGIVPVEPTIYQSIYGTTEFAGSDRSSLPRSLQQVITTWETLIR